jgi:glutathione-regulated potassium-efflux system ancillary protein KefF
MSDILVLAAHPDLRHSRINQALMQALRQAMLPRVVLRDLYALAPDYVIDVPAERAALSAARLVVWLHPVHWYSMPPLMRLWQDEVLGFGWAYGGGRALAGKDLWLVASTGGTEDSYRPDGHNRYFFDAFIPPYEQTAALIGMRWLPPLLFHGAHRASDGEIAGHAAVFVDRLATWPDWPELVDLEGCAMCEVGEGDRPATADPTPSTPASATAVGRADTSLQTSGA